MQWILPQEKFGKVPRGSKRLFNPCIFTPPKGEPELIFTNWWLGFTSLQPKTGKKLWELSVFGRPHSERAISSYCCRKSSLEYVDSRLWTNILLQLGQHQLLQMEKLGKFGEWRKPCPTFPLLYYPKIDSTCGQITE